MKQQGLSNAAMALQLGTSPSALIAFSIRKVLGTLQGAASVVGKRLRLDLVDARA
jgi:hypothetical protein